MSSEYSNSTRSSRTPTPPTNRYSRSPSPLNDKQLPIYFYLIISSFLAPILLLIVGLADFQPITFTFLIIFFVFYNIIFFMSNFYINKGGYPSSMYKFLSAHKDHKFLYFTIISLLISIPFIILITLKFFLHPFLYIILLVVAFVHFGYLFNGDYPFLS